MEIDRLSIRTHFALFVFLGSVFLGRVILAQPADDPTRIQLSHVTDRSGIDFVHTDGGTGERFIVEYISGGLASFDYDSDGLPDLYFLNGAPVGDTKVAQTSNRLYKNLGNFRFKDVTTEAGVGDSQHGLGVAAADLDNDGDIDLYLNNFGPNALYWNQGDGTFIPDQDPELWLSGDVGAGVSIFDADGDGNLDLFVANYVDFDLGNHPRRKFRGKSIYPSPQDFSPTGDRLFVSLGDGLFADRTAESGLAGLVGTGMGTIAIDYDADSDTDVFVCNDVMPNFLLENDGQGVFSEVALLTGVAVDFAGVTQGSMGVDAGDFDQDGYLDLLVTSYQDELPVVYRNSGQGFFEDVTVTLGALHTAVPAVTWGGGFCDFDNDGDLDIFMASGHLMDNVAETDNTQTYSAPNLLLENVEGKYRNLGGRAGAGLTIDKVSRGAIFEDLDNDGDQDVVILNSNSQPTLLRNDSQGGNWLEVTLVGRHSNRGAVGTRVEVFAGDQVWVQEVHNGRGYQSHHSGERLHFGLGTSKKVDKVIVHWHSGEPQTYLGIPVNSHSRLVQQAK